MHIPDGFIPITQCIIYAIITIILLGVMYYKTGKKNISERSIPLIAMFIVAVIIIQYINIPLPFVACTHISLIAFLALYDPWIATVVLAFAVFIQGIFLGEGGITTMGADMLNTAIIGPTVAYVVYNISKNKLNNKISIFLAAFLSVTIVGIAAAIELYIAGIYPLELGLTLIAGTEAIVGIVEGIITVFLMLALNKIKPELVPVLNS
ncbi:MAG: energy-coupling factor ABC transporter permease [Methanobacteriaceae archaeon]|nr:energy-coupling factor ABC transporter permease [Methanobacteriaceae archaeon]